MAKEPQKRLYRSRTNQVIAGVCGGIGEYFGVDPTLVRLIWVIFALTGAGVAAYIICMLIIPEEPKGGKEKPHAKVSSKNHAWFGGVLILLGIILLFEKLISFRYLWPFALIAIGIAMVLKGMSSE